MPVLVETMAYIGDKAGVDYDLGTDKEVDSDLITESQIAVALKKVKMEAGVEPEVMEQEELPMEMEEPLPSGLMARRM